MNAEPDPLLLAALFDDELDPESRVLAESAARSSSIATEHLADLARVRDAVAALPPGKPGPDLSAAIVATLRHRQRIVRWRLAAMTTVAASLAATFLVMVQTGNWGPLPVRPATMPGPRSSSGAKRVPPTPLPVALALAPPSVRPVATVPGVQVAIRPKVLAAEVKLRDDRATLRSLIAEGEAKRVDIVVDDLGPALGAVDSIVNESPRLKPQHAKVHLVHSVDPTRPGACVYVLVMDGYEYKQFRRRLDDRFPESAGDPATDPGKVVASLGSVGRIEISSRGQAIASLRPPPDEAKANISSRAPRRDTGREVVIDATGKIVRPAEMPDRRPASTDKGDKRREPAADTTQAVYLVWVTPRERGRP